MQSVKGQTSAQGVSGDASSRISVEDQLLSATAKLEELWSVSFVSDPSIKELCDSILDVIVRMTESAVGFYGTVDENESAMIVHSWSSAVMSDSAAAEMPARFPLSGFRLWAEAIHKREPFILNDAAASGADEPSLPVGHIPIESLCVVPIFARDAMVAIAAVANRKRPYTLDDVHRITALIASVQSIVDHRRGEEQLRESEEKYRVLFENAGDAIFIADAKTGVILDANKMAERMIGLSKRDLIGMNQTALHSLAGEIDGDFSTSAASEGVTIIESSVIDRSGRRIPVRISAAPAELGGRKILHGIFRDITESKRAEEKILAQLDELHRWQDVMLDREDRVQELKREVNDLCRRLCLPTRYPSQEEGPP